MLAELFMLRLESLARTKAQTAETSDTRFVPFRIPFNPSKTTSTKISDVRTGK